MTVTALKYGGSDQILNSPSTPQRHHSSPFVHSAGIPETYLCYDYSYDWMSDKTSPSAPTPAKGPRVIDEDDDRHSITTSTTTNTTTTANPATPTLVHESSGHPSPSHRPETPQSLPPAPSTPFLGEPDTSAPAPSAPLTLRSSTRLSLPLPSPSFVPYPPPLPPTPSSSSSSPARRRRRTTTTFFPSISSASVAPTTTDPPQSTDAVAAGPSGEDTGGHQVGEPSTSTSSRRARRRVTRASRRGTSKSKASGSGSSKMQRQTSPGGGGGGSDSDSDESAYPSGLSPTSISPASPLDAERPRRVRILTTPYQAQVLQALLEETLFPTSAQREEIGRVIGWPARKVQIWFQNQRQKIKKRQRGEIQVEQIFPGGATAEQSPTFPGSPPHPSQYHQYGNVPPSSSAPHSFEYAGGGGGRWASSPVSEGLRSRFHLPPLAPLVIPHHGSSIITSPHDSTMLSPMQVAGSPELRRSTIGYSAAPRAGTPGVSRPPQAHSTSTSTSGRQGSGSVNVSGLPPPPHPMEPRPMWSSSGSHHSLPLSAAADTLLQSGSGSSRRSRERYGGGAYDPVRASSYSNSPSPPTGTGDSPPREQQQHRHHQRSSGGSRREH